IEDQAGVGLATERSAVDVPLIVDARAGEFRVEGDDLALIVRHADGLKMNERRNLSRVEQGLNLSAAEGVGPERDMGDLAIEVTDGVGRAVGDRVGVLGIAAQEKVRVCAEDFDAAGGGTALGQDAVEIE